MAESVAPVQDVREYVEAPVRVQGEPLRPGRILEALKERLARGDES